MDVFPTSSGVQAPASTCAPTGRFLSISTGMLTAIYAVVLAASISIWFLAIHAPLWLDETVSLYLIRGGFAGIRSRQVWPDSPVYSCLLWLWTRAMGTTEVTLRISSVLPMLAAVYLLYRTARELFARDVAFIAAILFSLHSIIIFAAIDVRPYAFAALTINATLFALVRLRHNNTLWLAALFGLLSASIVQFQLLFASILPALAVCFVALKWNERKVLLRQMGIALVTFSLAFIPVMPRLQYMAHTRGTHVFSPPPQLFELGSTLTLRGLALILVPILMIAAAVRHLDWKPLSDRWPVLLCVSLALVPSLILFGLSVGTSIHVFVPRYRLVAVPGVALCWALLANLISSRGLRLVFCLAVFVATGYHYLTVRPPHGYSWKYALEFIEKNASPDNAPALICSDIPEADHMRMPEGAAIEDTGILPPLSYYKLTVPVAPLPRTLNEETLRAGSAFIDQATRQHKRFLAAAFAQSYATLDWLTNKTAEKFSMREQGSFDGVRVLEFTPRDQAKDVR